MAEFKKPRTVYPGTNLRLCLRVRQRLTAAATRTAREGGTGCDCQVVDAARRARQTRWPGGHLSSPARALPGVSSVTPVLRVTARPTARIWTSIVGPCLDL